MKLISSLTLAGAAWLLAQPALAQFAKPDQAIEYRQGALYVMGQHFGRIGAMVNGKVPFDAAAAQENADLVVVLAKLPWAAFGPGTEGGKAKDEVWKNPAQFKEGNEKLTAATLKLAAAAKTGNLETLKVAFGDTAAACKSCHDNFRQK
ncbi:MAG: cytochrome c [Curvibacter sp.]|nr:cytochrome c [Curvibacter sp.]